MMQLNQQASAMRENYLHQVNQRFQGRLSPLEAYEAIEEMRDHLNSMALAYQELGVEPEPAMASALAKFGDVNSVGGDPALAQSIRRRVVLYVAGVPHAIASCMVGALLMTCFDYAIWSTTQGHRMLVPLDMGIGTVMGVTVAFLAWRFHRWPLYFSFGIVALIQIFLGMTLYQTYASLGHDSELQFMAIGFAITSFVLALFSAWTAKVSKGVLPRLYQKA